MTIRHRRTYWTAAGILLATLAIGLLAAGGGKAATKSTAPPLPEVGVIHVLGEDVSTHRAMLRTAELNLEYATIRAPIGGRVGDSLLQVGGLVTKTSAQPLTTIVPLDPVWVRFQVSEAELPLFERAHSGAVPIELVLGDGIVHPHRGHIVNTLNSVNTKTGTMEVQAMFGNPDHAVLPGQFTRVRVRTAERMQALLVPQKAVQELQGQQSVLTLGPDNTVAVRGVVTAERVDQRWIVEQGLKPGEAVIVEGLQKVRPGARVTPRPNTDPTTPTTGRRSMAKLFTD